MPIWASLVGAVGVVLAATIPVMVNSGSRTDISSPAITKAGPTKAGPTTSEPGPGPDTTAPESDEDTSPDDPSDTPSNDRELTTAEQSLADRIVDGDLYDCHSADNPGTGTSAALNCSASNSVPLTEPLVVSFDTNSDLNAWMATEFSSYDAPDDATACGDEQNFKGSWRYQGVVTGTLACYWKNDKLRIAWSYTDALVAAVAEDSDAEALLKWWNSDPLQLCACTP
ncbi:hypothetical protein AB5J56_25085 [Streptomyces sp. R21]|uniref:Uncharacterized protein n=1 Tax=Streptomyces sp. R21 TaxID=3238627 RepID=A0AB39PD41_9ACTN